ncbi:MAG: hypothetical protein HY420_02060 [Candidatus Kerfeldbacteria bacterium]|nr:hypothetical protein [Candidatus Kerfeldbacteria bacterium]
MNKQQLLVSIPLFLALYLLPPLIMSAVGIRGIALLIASWVSFVVQILVTIVFFRARQTTAGFVGTVTVMIQVVLYIVSNFLVLGR